MADKFVMLNLQAPSSEAKYEDDCNDTYDTLYMSDCFRILAQNRGRYELFVTLPNCIYRSHTMYKISVHRRLSMIKECRFWSCTSAWIESVQRSFFISIRFGRQHRHTRGCCARSLMAGHIARTHVILTNPIPKYMLMWSTVTRNSWPNWIFVNIRWNNNLLDMNTGHAVFSN